MTPLQKIAMGLVIVLLPANFPANPSPEWAYYDALADPIGWLLVLAGVWALDRNSGLDLSVAKWLGTMAFLISVPLWFPQVNHLLVPEFNPDIEISGQWFVALPQTLFALFLARAISRAGRDADDRYLAGRFGVLVWGFATLVVLPVIAYGGGVASLEMPSLVLIGIVNFCFIYYLFASHRRVLLGGPGPRDWTEVAQKDQPQRNEPPSE